MSGIVLGTEGHRKCSAARLDSEGSGLGRHVSNVARAARSTVGSQGTGDSWPRAVVGLCNWLGCQSLLS